MQEDFLKSLKNFKDKFEYEKIKKAMAVKNNKKVYIGISLIIILFLGFYIGYAKNSKEYFLNKVQSSLEKKQYGRFIDFSKLNDQKIKNKKSIKPFFDYINSKEGVSNFINSLKKTNEWNNCVFFKEKKGIFLNKYFMEFTGRDLNLTSNFDEVKIYANNKYLGDIKKAGEVLSIKNLLPGKYEIVAVLDGKFKFKKEDYVVILDKINNLNIKLNGIKISINTIYEDAEVYLNGENTNIKAENFKDQGPFPTDESIKVSIKNKFPWGEISSNEFTIKDLPLIEIPINMVNDKMQEQIKESVEQFYNGVFEALSKEDENSIKGVSQKLKDKVFSILKQKYFILKNIYKVNGINVDFKQSDFQYKNKNYTGNVVVKIKYLVEKNIFGVPLTSKEYNKNFFAYVKYDFKKNVWQVEDIDNFSLDLSN